MSESPDGNEIDHPVLDPRSTRLVRDPYDRLVLTLGTGVDEFVDVHPVCAFPISVPEEDVVLLDAEGREIGLIASLAELDPESRRVLREELNQVYLTTRVQAVRDLSNQYGFSTWHLDTDRGPRVAPVRDRSNLRVMPDGRIFLVDVHGIRYEIPSLASLDERSQAFLEAEL